MISRKHRNIQLDVLRGVAILLVLGRHLELPKPNGVLGVLAEAWYRVGWIGVDLFFVLSGFLIGGLLVKELDKHGEVDVIRFLIRRGLKIYPMYFVFMAYLIMMPMAKTFIAGGDVWTLLGERWKILWPNLLFLQNYVGDNPIGHSWSLAVEEHFYLMLPFVLAFLAALGRIRLLVPLCLAFVPICLLLRFLSVWFTDPFFESMAATHLRIDALLLGVAIRGVAQFKPDGFMAARKWRSVLVATGVILWMPNLFIDPSTSLIRTVGLTGTLLGAAAFLLATYHTHAHDFRRTSLFVHQVASVVAWIGVYSYGIYLWHITAIGILEREFAGRLLSLAGTNTQLIWLVSAIVVGSGAILTGVFFSKVMEYPVLRLRDRFFPSRSGSLPSGDEKIETDDDSTRRMPICQTEQ